MGTVVKFTPLIGVGEDAPLCSLLEIDDYCILLDCGWSEDFDEAQLEPVKRYTEGYTHGLHPPHPRHEPIPLTHTVQLTAKHFPPGGLSYPPSACSLPLYATAACCPASMRCCCRTPTPRTWAPCRTWWGGAG